MKRSKVFLAVGVGIILALLVDFIITFLLFFGGVCAIEMILGRELLTLYDALLVWVVLFIFGRLIKVL